MGAGKAGPSGATREAAEGVSGVWADPISNRGSLYMIGFSPNEHVSRSIERYYSLAFGTVLTGLWAFLPSKIIPSPTAILLALGGLWSNGFMQELYTSLVLIGQAVAVMALISLAVGYATVVPALRPLGTAFAAGRFNSFVGLPLVLTLLIADQHVIKVIILAIGMSVFSVQPIQDIIECIPKERFDDARTLRMSEWRVTWEVVVLGTFDQVLDVLRTCSAMGFVMLPLVEGTFRSEGGIGVFLLQENKYLHLDTVYAAIIAVAMTGLFLDRLWLGMKHWICPYAFIGRESV